MKSPLIAALIAASALTALPTIGFAGETTIIREHRVLVPDTPPPAPVQAQTQTQIRQQATVRRVAVRHVTRHRAASVHHIVRHTQTAPATGAADAATETSATVRQDTQAQAAQPATAASDPAPQMVEDRRTVVRRDDDGSVERRTRIIRQGPNGMTSIEHRSAEGPSEDTPAP